MSRTARAEPACEGVRREGARITRAASMNRPHLKKQFPIRWKWILRNLGAWHDPPACRSLGPGRPAGLPPPGAPGPYTYEPCDDVDPMPDYENVLTD